MLKIKSNTNEFTIIFSEKIGKKKNAQKISFNLCSVQHPFFFSPSFLLVSVSFLFSASVFSAPFVSFQRLLFSFQFTCALFFSPKHFCFSPKPFSVQPTPLFQPLFVLFQPFFFLLILFSTHLFFLFSASFSSFFFSASFSFL